VISVCFVAQRLSSSYPKAMLRLPLNTSVVWLHLLATAAPLVACGRPAAPSVSPEIAAGDTSNAVVSRLCKTATCSGKFAGITTFVKDGAISVYRFEGDLSTCSHPPWSYFDNNGKQLLVQAERPIVPGSPDAKKFEDERNAVLQGLSEGPHLRCGAP
jgi:hypothetical protein